MIGAFGVQQCIRYDYSEPVTNVRQRLVVVPPPRHGPQARLEWRVDVRGARAEMMRTEHDAFGNVRIEVALPRVRSWIEFHVGTTVAFRDDATAVVVQPNDGYVETTRLTAPDEGIAQLVAGCDRREPEQICRRVHQAMTYAYGTTDVHTTAAEALSGGRGVCQDYAHVMLAACRAAGMPARYVSGHLLGEGGSHAWVEVLRHHDGRRGEWFAEAWDPTHGRRTDESYITIATGRDYDDVAPISGTFDGRAPGRLTVKKLAHAREH